MEEGTDVERVVLFCGGQECGSVVLEREGSRIRVSARLSMREGLYRAVLVGQQGEQNLGVMAPSGGMLTAARQLYVRDVERLGVLLRGEARPLRGTQSAVTGNNWCKTERLGELITDEFLKERFSRLAWGYYRRQGQRLLVALPWERGQRFPVTALFCLATLERIEGCVCVVYCFQQGRPQLPTGGQ